MRTWAYVFIATRQPRKVLRMVRRLHGVVHADALFGSPDVIAIVAGGDIAEMDAVIDRVAEIRLVAATDSKIARWIDDVELPLGAMRRSAPTRRRRRRT